jgi:hypothetical protein
MSTLPVSTPEPSIPISEHPDFDSLLKKIACVFGHELDMLTPGQEAVLNGLIYDRIKARGGDPSAVTTDEVEGCRELLYNEFTMAAVL